MALAVICRLELVKAAGSALLFRLELFATDVGGASKAGSIGGVSAVLCSSIGALAAEGSKSGSTRRSGVAVLFSFEPLAVVLPCTFTGVEVGRPCIAEAVVLRGLWRTSGTVGKFDEMVAVTPAG
jgi:hypothetical protein